MAGFTLARGGVGVESLQRVRRVRFVRYSLTVVVARVVGLVEVIPSLAGGTLVLRLNTGRTRFTDVAGIGRGVRELSARAPHVAGVGLRVVEGFARRVTFRALRVRTSEALIADGGALQALVLRQISVEADVAPGSLNALRAAVVEHEFPGARNAVRR